MLATSRLTLRRGNRPASKIGMRSEFGMVPAPSLRFAHVVRGATFGLACLSPALAKADPPSTEHFNIRYVRPADSSNPNSTRKILDGREMAYFANRSRCECGVELEVEIRLNRSKPIDNEYLEVRVGRDCDDGATVLVPVGRKSRCLRLAKTTAPSQTFRQMVRYRFPVYWLASGIGNGSPEDYGASPFPLFTCVDDEGSGGIWMCAGTDNCREGTYFMTGTTSTNPTLQIKSNSSSMQSRQGSTGGNTGSTGSSSASGGGLNFDFLAPQAPVMITSSTPGDGAIKLSWTPVDNLTGDITGGYRVLCRPKGGDFAEPHPAAKAVLSKFSTETRNLADGTIYWPKSGVLSCQELPSTDTGDATSNQSTTSSATTSGTATGTTTDLITDTTAYADETAEILQTTTATTDDTDTTPGDDPTTTTDSTSESGTTSTVERPDTPLTTLDWKYICSDHVSQTTRSARISHLQNGVEYEFLVVSFDREGNPNGKGNIAYSTPVETNGFWDQCQAQGDACGEVGFCAVQPHGPSSSWLAVLGCLAWPRARRFRARRRAA